MKTGAIILSGGKSSRMGSNKALLELDDTTAIQKIHDEFSRYFEEIILVTNEQDAYSFLQAKMIPDEYPGKGPLAGIHAGLKAAETDVNIIAACDMPFLSGKAALALLALSEGYEAVVPVIGGKRHPLFAVYKKDLLPAIELCLQNDDLRLMGMLQRQNVRYVTEADLPAFAEEELQRIFFNMNYPEDYEAAKNRLSQE